MAPMGAHARGDVSGIDQTLARFEPTDGLPDLRGFEWYYHSLIRSLFVSHWNQGSPVEDVALSNDGSMVASLGAERGLNVFDAKSNSLLRTLDIEAGRFRSLAFSPVTKLLASGSTDGTIRIWEPSKNAQPKLELKHGPPVAQVEFSGDGTLVLSAATNGAARIWNLQTEGLLAEIPTGQGENRDVKLSPDSQFVAVAKEDGRVRVTEVSSLIVQHQFRPNPGIEVVAWSPDSTAVATGSYSGAIRVWSLEDGELRFESGTGMGQIGDMEFLDDRVLSVVGVSGQLLLIDIESGKEMRHLATHILSQGVLDVSPDGRALGVGSGDGSIKLLDVKALVKPTVFWHAADVRHVAFMNSGTRLLTADSQGTVTNWNVSDGVSQSIVEGRVAATRVYATQRAGSLIAAAGNGSRVSIVSSETGNVVATADSSAAGVITAMQFSPDDHHLTIGHRDGTLAFFSNSDWATPQFAVSDIGGGINALAFSPDGRVVAVACSDETIQSFETKTGDKLSWQILVGSVPLAVTYCEGGGVLAIGTSTGELQLWDVKKQSLRSTIKAHTSRINALSVFPDGTTLASGGRDRRLQLWDTKSGERLTTLRGHSRQFFAIDVSSDGKTVASGGLAGDARIWRSDR
jgi:eukaryotic-like serine/threonine-protein kinase